MNLLLIDKGSVGPFPPPPSRWDMINFRIPMQGFTARTQQFGTFPSFGIETSVLDDVDLDSHCTQLKAQGFTHAMFDWSWNYIESDFQYPVPGRDLTNDLEEIRRRITLIVARGLKVVFFLAGDGLSHPDRQYNDPQGWTYGYEWLCERFPALARYLKNGPIDLTQYIIFMPGFDAVFYGWGVSGEIPDQQPARVANFGRIFREALPDGYLGIEHTPGNIPVGEGAANFAISGLMDAYDTVASEFSYPNIHNDATWQIVARLVHGYQRPSDQPSGDDPSPPFTLLDCPRGPRAYVAMEYKTYGWVRGMSADAIHEDRVYLQSLNATNVC